MPRFVDIEKAEPWLHREDWGTPDERWRPESEFGMMLDALPTENVKIARRGKWIVHPTKNGDYYYECSIRESNWELKGATPDNIVVALPECPRCGADMSGG